MMAKYYLLLNKLIEININIKILLFFLFNCLAYNINSQEIELPWLDKIISHEKIKEIHSIYTQADVSVSDGLTYQVKTLYHDNQRAVFHRIYPNKVSTNAIEGKYVWEFDGTKEIESKAFMGAIVLGHQFFAKILLFNKMHPVISSPENGVFVGSHCTTVSTKNEASTWKFYYQEKGLPLGMELIPNEGSKITFLFSDWKKEQEIKLPYTVMIDDGTRKFKYHFTKIDFNTGSIKDFRAPENLLTDEQKLLRLHRNIMDDHLFERTETMSLAMGDSIKIVSAGEIYNVGKKQSTERLNTIMSNRNYTLYDDLVRPTVKISEDGTLGWVIVQVSAKGVRLDENRNETGPLEFVCAWIELYEKVNGKWLNIGNISNFKPGRK